MRAAPGPLVALLVALAPAAAATGQTSAGAATEAAPGTLDIWFVDTEGGQATLYVSPTGETMLVDTGNPGERDHGRILEVLALAGARRIDHLFLTHYHGDHHGGLEALARRVPVGRFYDHGPSIESDRPRTLEFERVYRGLHGDSARTVVKPGDRVPLAGVEVTVVASHGEVLGSSLPGAPGAGEPNPACADHAERDESAATDPDNDYSAGFVLAYGDFRTINLGDLTWNREGRLMCPVRRVGTVDLYVTSHHGIDRSGSPALVHGVRPRVAVMNNGLRKGGSAQSFRILHASPGLEDLWQLHWSQHGEAELNAPGLFIANLEEASDHAPAHWLRVSARADGSFTVTNGRNGFSKTYGPEGR